MRASPRYLVSRQIVRLEASVSVEQQFRRSQDFVYRPLAGEDLLIAVRSHREAPLFTLSESGASLWQSLEHWVSVPELVAALTERFEVSDEAAHEDVLGFLSQLREVGAIEEQDAQ